MQIEAVTNLTIYYGVLKLHGSFRYHISRFVSLTMFQHVFKRIRFTATGGMHTWLGRYYNFYFVQIDRFFKPLYCFLREVHFLRCVVSRKWKFLFATKEIAIVF